MYHRCDLFCESFLERSAARVLQMVGHKCLNGLLIKVGKDLDIALGIVVTDVEPELIEGIWRGTIAVEPHVSTLCFAEFPPICLRNQRTGETESLGFIAQSAANQFGSRGHIAPLVIASELQTHAMMLIEIEEIVALKQLISELGERKSVVSLAVQALLYAVFSHHVVDGDVLAHLSCKVKKGELLHPIVVIDQLGLVGFAAIEVKKLCNLPLDGLLIVV